MRCPECFEEIVLGDADCPYCGADLGALMDVDSDNDRNFVTLVTVCDEHEAFCIRDLLENQGIQARISPYGTNSSSFLTESDEWGEIIVSESALTFADKIVSAYMASSSRPPCQEVPSDDDIDEDSYEEDE